MNVFDRMQFGEQQASQSNSNSPSHGSEDQEESGEEGMPLAQISGRTDDRSVTDATKNPRQRKMAIGVPKAKKKYDPNEPAKPPSAYALFFRDTQSTIKSRNPSASFGEVSKAVQNMWEMLDDESKSAYKARVDVMKKEYLRQLAAYRATQNSNTKVEPEYNSNASSVPESTTSVTSTSGFNIARSRSILSSAAASSAKTSQAPLTELIMEAEEIVEETVETTRDEAESGDDNSDDGVVMIRNEMDSGDKEWDEEEEGMERGLERTKEVEHCIRAGCPNPAIEHPGWDGEYCSSDCVVKHCKDVFKAWQAWRKSAAFTK